MMAISTNILKYLKVKFSPIGQGLNGGAQGSNAEQHANALNLQKEASVTAKQLTDAAKAAATYTDAVAALNIGIVAGNKLQSDMNINIKETTELITFLEQKESKLTGTFGAGTLELARRSEAFADIQSTMGVTTDQMVRYRATMEVNADLFGKVFADAAAKNADFIKGQTAAFHYLTENTQLSTENQASLQLYAAGANRSIEQQVLIQRTLATALGDTVDKSKAFEEIAEGIAGLSSDIRTQYNKMPGSLEMAVLKSKQLGLSMEQLHNSGKSLLDIETSVGKELEYQLLSGKRLTKDGKSLTNAYRQAFLEGNMDKQADIMKDVLVTQREVLDSNNFLAKQALADSMGITLKDLMYMREKEKLQDKLNEQLTEAGVKGVELDKVLKDPEYKRKLELDIAAIGGATADKISATLDTVMAEVQAGEETRKSPAEKIYELLQSKLDVAINQKFTPGKDGTAAAAKTSAIKYATETSKAGSFAGTTSFQEEYGKVELRARAIDDTKTAIDGLTEKIPVFGTAIKAVTTKLAAATKLLTGDKVKDLKVKESADPGKTGVKVQDGIVQTTDGGTISFDKRDKISIVASPFGTMNEKVAEKIATPDVVAQPTNTANINQVTNKVSNQQDLTPLLLKALSQINSQPTQTQTIDTNAIVKAIEQAFKNINLDVNVGIDPMAIDKEIKFRSGNLRSNV